jgi:superfamily II DNA or RNA helicase
MMREPIYIESGAVCYPDKKLIKQMFRMSRFDQPYQLSYQFSEPDGTERLAIPRNSLPWGDAVDLRDKGVDVAFESHFQPHPDFPEQPGIIAQSVALLEKDVSHIVQAPTGFGKTFVGSEIGARIGKRFLVITTKEDIIDQWVAALSAVLGIEKEDVGIWQADRCDMGKPVTVGLVQSILKGPDRYGKEAYQGYGLVIADEVHRMAADTFSQAMWHLPAKLRLGLSATPDRKDGKEEVFESHIGKVMVEATQQTMVPKVFCVRTKWKVPRTKRQGRIVKLPHSPGKVGHIEKSMAYDAARTRLIVELISQAHTAGRALIVFAGSMAMLEAIEGGLQGVVPEDDIGYYVGLQFYKGPKAEKKRKREKATLKPVILATYQMASEATNIPWLDACLFATPRSDVVQIVGRIRRVYEDKKQPVVFDILDNDSHVFEAYAKKRHKWYHSIGAPVQFTN